MDGWMDRSSTESKVSACLTTLLEVGLESAQHALALKVERAEAKQS
jgi:hypothetical protein